MPVRCRRLVLPVNPAQDDFEDFSNPDDTYASLDLDSIAELPSVTVPHAVGVAVPRDKEK